MGCRSDYMYPSKGEVELSKVAYLIDEINLGVLDSFNFKRGYHPKVYNTNVNADELVSTLCGLCKTIDVSEYSLELQMWWRDHQIADKLRTVKTTGVEA